MSGPAAGRAGRAQPPSDGPRVVALGGGHGLAASLQALRQVTPHLTAVVTVADDGGSSGRLRDELGVLPPGDLRMALAALAGEDDWGRTWEALLQHRFAGDGPLAGHAVGNLVLAGLTGSTGDAIRALDLTASLVGAVGRVLPMSCVPLEIVAEVIGADASNPMGLRQVVGQVAVATTRGAVAAVSLRPVDPPACAESVAAVRRADWVVLGPGSWFTSVLPHLLVPDLRAALVETSARTLVCLNLAEQAGETAGFSPEAHLEVLAAHAPELVLDVVLADEQAVVDPHGLMAVVRAAGARLVLAPVARGDGTPRHHPDRLAEAFALVFGEHPPAGRGTPEAQAWR
ncbi:MAG: uridine diphosphate-N-acetylglucosamine-binding protein YvcK [Actinobacteria bacterium]|nr:uridine diphosphate-N-acetylglucosamine-binding protein YvcK [Actinomycetota bacterium]MBW3646871.1 uridine diphosphate-N-acetylglucosamine-binding protein YvcK [Actinomycetota bacterium]